MARISGVYDGLTLTLMKYAYMQTCRMLRRRCSDGDCDLIAKRILGSAALGERDPTKMRDDAIAYMNG
jgi:hypothetical protein